MGVLPLRTLRHGEFLRDKVHGISIPGEVISRMKSGEDPLAEGNRQAREMITLARELFAGVCIMPPFDHYEVLSEILG
jgi:homocysteine S-methyltransferase